MARGRWQSLTDTKNDHVPLKLAPVASDPVEAEQRPDYVEIGDVGVQRS